MQYWKPSILKLVEQWMALEAQFINGYDFFPVAALGFLFFLDQAAQIGQRQLLI